MGTWESLTSPRREMVNKDTPYTRRPILQGKYRRLARRKEKYDIASGIQTEGKEKEEGSLNMLVVPKESREISPMKAGD